MSYARIEDDQESLELQSLASSGVVNADDPDARSVSSRGLSPLGLSPFGSEPAEDDNEELRQLRQDRSLSVSTIGDHLFNLAASNDIGNVFTVPLEKQKQLNLFHGLGLVVGLQIGSGIFASPSQVNSNAGSVGTSLLVWALSGLLAWTGGSSYAELGSAIPLNGGSQAYLQHIFGPFPAFLFTWTAATVLKPGSAAIVSIIFAEYFTRGTGVAFLVNNIWIQKLVALVGLWAVAGVNCYSTRLGAQASNVFLVMKISMLVAITIIGFVFLNRYKADNAFSEPIFEGASTDLGDYAIALYAGLWAYDGWDNMNYVSAEMKNPKRDLPRSIHIAMPVVILAYIFVNVAYFCVLSKREILSSNTVSLTFANKMFGAAGGAVFAFLISLSCLGSLNASTFTAARLLYSAAEEGFIPSRFSQLNSRRNTPVSALLLHSAFTSFFVLVGAFESLLTFYGVTAYVFYFLCVFGVILLRIRQPDLERPYKPYIATPVLFCCVALFLILRTVFEEPFMALLAVIFIACGIPIYVVRFGWPKGLKNIYAGASNRLHSMLDRVRRLVKR